MSRATFITQLLRLCLGVCAIVTCGLIKIGSAQTNAVRSKLTQPYVMREDFEGDSLGQWASYPPAQDIGYEPSISPTTAFNSPGGRALMRVVRPPGAGTLSIGFIKRVNLVSNGEMRLAFSYRVNTLTNSTITIGLAGTNARLYTTRIPGRNNVWATGDVHLTDFRDQQGQTLPTGVGVEAVYIVSEIEKANPDTTYRFLIDNILVSAAHEANFKFLKPSATQIEPWTSSISQVGHVSGDKLAIEAAAPSRLARADVALQSAGRTIVIGALYDDGTHGDQRAQDGIWSNDSLHKFSSADSAGLWIAEVRGTTADGSNLTTGLRFIVHPADTTGHPRLFFTATDRQILVARTRNPKLSAMWAKLRERAKATRASGELARGGETFELLDREYLLPSLLAYFDVLNRARARISTNSFDAYITGDKEARDAARSALLDVARWSRWNPPWFEEHGQHTYYPAGQLAVEVALGYDLLYEDLSAEERALIRSALIEKSILPTYKEYVLDNRAMANTSNWISHTVSGALIAAAAITGDGPSLESGGRLETYINGLLLKLEDHMSASFLPDGSYGEGTSYQEFDLETLGIAMPAIKRVFGVDYYAQTHVKDSLIYSLYTLAQPTSASLDMGDTHTPTARTLAPLVAQTKDPVIRWFYQLFDHSSLIDFIFFDDLVQPNPPTLPASRIFFDKGYASLRSGWKPDDWLLLFRAGPTFNHNHSDQGSFLLTAFGENLISEAGWSDYYKDPYYETFFTQAIGHNTVLIDGDAMSQTIADTAQFPALNNHPRITDAITSEFYDAVSSDLSSVYKGRLTRYTRRIVFLKPHYLVVYDDLAAKDVPANFDWLLHLPDRARTTAGKSSALYKGTNAALAVQVLGPADSQLSIRNGRIPYPVFSASTPKAVPAQPAFLDVHTGAPTNALQFLVGLVPARTADEAQSTAARMSRIDGSGFVGMRTSRGNENDLIVFRTSNTSGVSRYQDWTTDAEAWSLTQAGDRLRMFAVQLARSFTRTGRVLIRSDQPISLAANYQNEVSVSYSASSPTKLTLFVGSAPASMLIDQTALPESGGSFDRNAGTITLAVPAGRHNLTIRLQ